MIWMPWLPRLGFHLAMCDSNHRLMGNAHTIFKARRVYTVRVDRKGAWFLVAIMLLSAAIPGLACLAPTHPPACCQQMAQGCNSTMATAGSACCKIRSTDTRIPPALVSQPENDCLSSQLVLTAILLPAPISDAAFVPPGESPTTASASARSSILRI